MEEQFEKLMERDYSSQDQDILNVACYGKIKILPLKYNVMNKYYVSHPKIMIPIREYPSAFQEKSLKKPGKIRTLSILRIDGNHGMTWLVTWQKSGGKKLWLPVSSYLFEDFYLEIQKHQRRISETKQKENERLREKVLNERRKIENKYNKIA